jgi:hypothetical protein
MAFKQDPQIKSKKIAIILAALQEYPHIGDACRKARIGVDTYRLWRKADPELAEAHREAMLGGDEHLEDAAMQKALKDKDTTMIIFLLKTRIRDRYADRLEHTGAAGSPIQIVLAQREDGPQ